MNFRYAVNIERYEARETQGSVITVIVFEPARRSKLTLATPTTFESPGFPLVEPEQAGLAAGVVTSTLQIGSAVGVAAVGSVFFTVLGQKTGSGAYGDAFAGALAVAAFLQVLGMLLATKMNHRRRPQTEVALPADNIQSQE